MPGRTPAEAVNNYIDSIQLVVSCVSDSVVTVRGGYYVSDTSHILDLNEGNPIRIRGSSRLWLAFRQYYRIIESEIRHAPWTVVVEGYEYNFLDSDQREILAYHWHSMGQSAFISQHLHIGHGAMAAREELHTAHLPTGYVSLADIIRLLVRDFRATPRRRDWESILSE